MPLSFFLLRTRWLAVLAGLLLTGFTTRAQAPAWQLALDLGAFEVRTTATDSTGSVYVAGTYVGTPTLGTTTLPPGNSDAFVAKYTPGTGFVWALATASPGSDGAYPRALLVSGRRVYVAGWFAGPSLGVGASMLTGNRDAGFVARIDDYGTAASWAWAQGVAGSPVAYARALAVRGSNVYVAGEFGGASLTLGATTLTNASTSDDMFVARLADQGTSATWTWAERLGGANAEFTYGLATGDSSLYLIGTFRSPALQIGATTLGNFSTNSGCSFIAKLLDRGGSSPRWGWAIVGASNNGTGEVHELVVNGRDVYAAGTFATTLTLGATTLTSQGGSDLFVARLADNGPSATWQWAKAGGGTGLEYVEGLAVRGSTVYVAGSFQSPTATFGATTLTNTNPSFGYADLFVARLTSSGTNAGWTGAVGVAGANDERIEAIAASDTHLYVVGKSGSRPLQFGNVTFPNTNANAFLAALADPSLAIPAESGGQRFSLAPNPAHTIAQLSGAAPGTCFTLVDALSRAVLTTTADAAGTARLEVRRLPAGVYLLRGAGVSRRLVVE